MFRLLEKATNTQGKLPHMAPMPCESQEVESKLIRPPPPPAFDHSCPNTLPSGILCGNVLKTHIPERNGAIATTVDSPNTEGTRGKSHVSPCCLPVVLACNKTHSGLPGRSWQLRMVAMERASRESYRGSNATSFSTRQNIPMCHSSPSTSKANNQHVPTAARVKTVTLVYGHGSLCLLLSSHGYRDVTIAFHLSKHQSTNGGCPENGRAPFWIVQKGKTTMFGKTKAAI